MLYCMLYIILCLHRMIHAAAGNIGRACAAGQIHQIERAVDIAVNGGGGELTGRSHGRELAAGHAVDAVVDYHKRYINIPAAGMDKVVAAYCGGVAVAGDYYNMKIGVSHLYAGSKRKRAAVRSVQGIEIHVSGCAGGAAYTRDYNGLVAVKAQLIYGANYVSHHDAVAAAGAPDMGHMGLSEVILYVRHFEITAITSL